jgi:hypothetical protein
LIIFRGRIIEPFLNSFQRLPGPVVSDRRRDDPDTLGDMASKVRWYAWLIVAGLLVGGVATLSFVVPQGFAEELPQTGILISLMHPKALLIVQKSEAVLQTAERRVTVLSLMSYIRDQLPDLGKEYGIEIQEPVKLFQWDGFSTCHSFLNNRRIQHHEPEIQQLVACVMPAFACFLSIVKSDSAG